MRRSAPLLILLAAALPLAGCAPEPMGNRPAYPLNQASLENRPTGEVRAPATERSNWSMTDDSFSVSPPDDFSVDPLSGFEVPSTRVHPEREREW